MKPLKHTLIALMLLLPLSAAGVYLFKTLNAQNGLNSSQINCILKDSRGFVWFGTPSGLYRYDGYVFKNFQCNSHDGSSLPDSYVTGIEESLEGNLWIETASGLCVYDPQTESFERDMHQVFGKMGIKGTPSTVFIDNNKNLWAAIPKRGVVAYNMRQQLLYEFGYTDDTRGVPEGDICFITECRDGAIIVYRDGTLVCCDVSRQQQTVWKTDAVAKAHVRKPTQLRAFADQKDNIWLYGQGTLMVYYKNADTWDMTFGNRIGLSGMEVDRTVNDMAGDRNGNIWLATDWNGLMRMDVNSHEMEQVTPRNMNEKQLATNDIISVQSVYVDDTDLLWVGTEKSGVAFHGNNIYKFETGLYTDVTAIAQDADGKIWYGTSDKGVIGYDGPLASRRVTALAITPDGSLWVGSKRNGLTRIKDGHATIYSVSRDSTQTLINDHVNALCTDKSGNLWIATNGGLQVFNTRMNSFATYTKENGKLTTNNMTALFYGKGNKLYVGTGEGLMTINLSTNEQTIQTGNSTNMETFSSNYITQVYEDSRGLLWIGTRYGINILDPESDHIDYLTERDGLCSNSISGLTEDKNNNMWVTTRNGVSRVVVQRNHENGTFNYGLYNYSTADGLQNNEFNQGAILTKKDGNVLMGGLYGVNWILRHNKGDHEALPKVMLTQLFIDDTEVMVGHEYDGQVVLPQALNESNRIELTNAQSTFTIKFAAGNYNQSERLQFMFWMEGLNDNWHNGNPLEHGVTFYNLKSGTYKLHVKAVSADGGISNQERTLEIVIDSPWWMSGWMIFIYVAILTVVVYLWLFGIKRVSYLWTKKNAIIRELELQREEIKSTSDDLRQPMARMTTIIGNIAEKETTVEGKEQISSLHSQMLQIITRISEMQMSLENPETKAKTTADSKMLLNEKGEVSLVSSVDDVLTTDIRLKNTDLITRNYIIVFVDDNDDFLKFISTHLRNVYDMHMYNNVEAALRDLEILNADIIVCKQNMPDITGSEMCNRIKMNPRTEKCKFIIMTDGVLTSAEMQDMGISLSADDFLAKPFNLQESIIRFNKLLGLAPDEAFEESIEGKETRLLERENASMTTATTSDYTHTGNKTTECCTDEEDEPYMNEQATEQQQPSYIIPIYQAGETIGEYSMNSHTDKILMRNIEQYVLHNMSRGQISIDEMATAMGMGRVPFFRKVRSITSKTPAELIREIRLKHSCLLLQRTNINMDELAANLGFMTTENFTAIFKEKYGMSPIEYRMKHYKG